MNQSGTITKKGDRHYVITRYIDPATGRRHQKGHGGYPTKKEAQVALRKVLSDMDRGVYAAPDRVTVAAFLQDRWLPTLKASTLKPTTRLSYELHVREYLVPHLGAIPLQKLTTAHIEAFYADLLTTGGRNGTGLAPGTVRRIHATLTKSLGAAERWNLVARNVAKVRGIAPSQKVGKKEMRCWDTDQVRAFLGHVTGDRLYALWALAFARGMRRGELLGLRWEDVDLEKGQVKVRQALVQVGYEVVVSTPKTAKGTRTIPLDPQTVATLRAWKVRQAEERLAWGPGWQDTGLVFTRENGAWIHPDAATAAFARHTKEAGLPSIRFHDIRHTAATLLIGAGVPVKVVSEWLGHANIGITLDTYTHVMPAQEHAASEVMASLIYGAV